MRLKFLTYPRFQLTLVAVNVGLFLVFIAFVFYNVRSNYTYMVEMGGKAGLASDHMYYRVLAFQQELLLTRFFWGASGFIVFTVLFSLYVTHRLTGPLYRLQTYLEEYCRTRVFRKLAFRRNDYFDNLPQLINRALQSRRKKDEPKE